MLKRLKTSPTADAALISAAVFVFLLAAGMFFMMDDRHVRFYVSGETEMNVEYGHSFSDPGARASAVGAFSSALSALPALRRVVLQDAPGSMRPDSNTLAAVAVCATKSLLRQATQSISMVWVVDWLGVAAAAVCSARP